MTILAMLLMFAIGWAILSIKETEIELLTDRLEREEARAERYLKLYDDNR